NFTEKVQSLSSRTKSRAFSVPPRFGRRGTQRGICLSCVSNENLHASLQPIHHQSPFPRLRNSDRLPIRRNRKTMKLQPVKKRFKNSVINSHPHQIIGLLWLPAFQQNVLLVARPLKF